MSYQRGSLFSLHLVLVRLNSRELSDPRLQTIVPRFSPATSAGRSKVAMYPGVGSGVLSGNQMP